jgi:hypothetical protein
MQKEQHVMALQGMEQINQALNDMYNVFCQLPMEAQEFFVQKTHEFMHQRNNTSVYTFRVFKEFYKRALQYGVDIKNSSILEIGSGKPLGTGIFWNFVGAKNIPQYTNSLKST